MSPHTQIAIAFQKMVVAGQIQQSYEKYIAIDFRHHNPFFKGDRKSLMQGMEENHVQFPHKTFEVQRTIEEGDLVVIHSRLRLAPEIPSIATVHIFRFDGDMIAEEWDLGQQIPKDSPNEYGAF